MRSPRTATVPMTTAVIVALTLGACGSGGGATSELAEGGWEETVAAAEDEGSISFYSIAPAVQNDRLQAAFDEAYPDLDLQITRGATELPSRVEAEIQSGSGGADVLLYSDPAWFVDNQADLLEQAGPALDGWSDDSWAVQGKAPVAYVGPFSLFVWNTEMFPEGFTEWQDFLDPSVEGRLALRESLSPSVVGYLDFMEDQFGPEYLEGLAAQQPKFYASTVPLAQAIGSGEAGATNINNISNVKELIDTGAPIDYHVPTPAFAIKWAAGAIATSERPNAAVVFLDFLMSKEGQEALNGEGFGAAGREDVDGDLDLGDAVILDSTEYTPEVLAEWGEKFEDYFGRSSG